MFNIQCSMFNEIVEQRANEDVEELKGDYRYTVPLPLQMEREKEGEVRKDE